MARLPNNATHFVATAFGSSKATTVVTNASEAVITSVAHGFSAGDIVEITSGWGRLNRRVARVKSPTTDTFVAEGMDTSSTTLYSPGTGIGSVRKVTAFTQVMKVVDSNTSGGTPKPVNYRYQEDENEYTLNDGFSAVNRTLSIDADTIGSAGYVALKALTEAQTDTIWKTVAKTGALIFLPCTVALNEEETTAGNIVCNQVALSGNNRSTRYAS